MKYICYLTISILLSISIQGTSFGQDTTRARENQDPQKEQNQFVDKNGDGYNDNAPDHDNDGIPNGLDPDYTAGMQKRESENQPFIDLDGDGINDYQVGSSPEKPEMGKPNKGPVDNKGGSMDSQKGEKQRQKRSGKQ